VGKCRRTLRACQETVASAPFPERSAPSPRDRARSRLDVGARGPGPPGGRGASIGRRSNGVTAPTVPRGPVRRVRVGPGFRVGWVGWSKGRVGCRCWIGATGSEPRLAGGAGRHWGRRDTADRSRDDPRLGPVRPCRTSGPDPVAPEATPATQGTATPFSQFPKSAVARPPRARGGRARSPGVTGAPRIPADPSRSTGSAGSSPPRPSAGIAATPPAAPTSRAAGDAWR